MWSNNSNTPADERAFGWTMTTYTNDTDLVNHESSPQFFYSNGYWFEVVTKVTDAGGGAEPKLEEGKERRWDRRRKLRL